MLIYAIKRIFYIIPVMFGVTLITFFMLYIAPSDPITMQYVTMGTVGDAKYIDEKKEEMGFNDPFIVQYSRWMKKAVQGDFGISIKYRKPVKEEILKRLPYTLRLAGSSIMLTIIIVLPLGILSAVYKNKFVDYIIRIFSFIGVSMPSFWLGLILMYILSVKLNVLPIMGNKGLKALVMPSITLSFWFIAIYIRRLRTSVLEEINKDYAIGLASRGLSFFKILLFHVLPNALFTIISMFTVSIGSILGGTVVIETIFDYQGIGKMAADAISSRDYFLMQAYVVWMSFIYVSVNMISDILQKYINPKLKLEGEN